MANQFFIKSTGLINGSGNDLVDFLNRMSTNDFRKLPAGEFRKTVLTTDKGRIIDLINVLNSSGRLVILTSNNYEEKVISHLNKYIITDDVILEKAENKFFNIIVTGEKLSEAGTKITGSDIVMMKNKIYSPGDTGYVFIDDFRIPSLNIICKEEDLQKYMDELKSLGFNEQSCSEYELMRIEAGLPEGENELNDNINPMECGLDKYISFVKGCYIGQEVIARLDSQGKRPKQMVKIKSENALAQFVRNDKIFTEETEAGFISSSINDDGKNIALGFIRSVNLNFEKKYFVKTKDGKVNITISKIN